MMPRWVPAMLNQEEEGDEAFFRQQEETSQLQHLVLMGDFSHVDSCRMSDMTGYEQSRTFLGCVNDNVLIQVLYELTRGDFLLDLSMLKKGKN